VSKPPSSDTSISKIQKALVSRESPASGTPALGSFDNYKPTAKLRQIKAEFWSKYPEEGLEVHPDINSDLNTLPAPLRRVPPKCWLDPQFVEWFNNRDEFKQRLEYLSHLALDTAEEILRNDEAPPAARVQMAKLVLEASGKTRADEKYLDQKIADMSREELEKYISGQLKVIAPSNSQDKETE
jgi:hypothetical protein